QNGDSTAIMRLIMAFVPRFLNPGREHFFLLGPRGTGKTSWCAHQFPNALRIDLLDPATLRPLSAQPERLAEMVAAAPRKPIVIDEIQKLPELLEVVHLLIERKTGQQFILTGSSGRKLRRPPRRSWRLTTGFTCARKCRWRGWSAISARLRAFLKP